MKINTFMLAVLAVSLLAGGCGNQQTSSDNQQAAGEVLESVPTEDNIGVNATVPDSAKLAEGGSALTLNGGDTFDFGTVKQGEKVAHDFTFKNTGTQPLIISDVQASCGCTTPDYTKTPVNPGEEGVIKVVYNTSGQGEGAKHKTVSVTSNAAEPQITLHIKGTVN
jgi:uncharacterized cupredoxin-like copper-binding protein